MLGLGLVLLTGAILLAPVFVPWNQFRSQVAALLADATGRQVVIDGDLSLRLLPVPMLTAANVRLLDSDTAVAAIDSIALEVQPWPLVSGDVKFKAIRLGAAKLRIREDSEGRRHWPIAPGAFGRAVHVESLIFSDSTLSWERPDQPTLWIEAIQGEVTAGGPEGPFEATAEGMIDAVPLRLTAAAGRRAGNGTTPLRVNLSLPTAKGEMRFAGIAATSNGTRRYEGDLTVQTVDSTPLLSLLRPAAGLEPLAAPPLGRALHLAARLTAAPDRLVLDGMEVKLGDSSATGSVDLPLLPGGGGTIVLASPLIDIDAIRDAAAPLADWRPPTSLHLDLLADQVRWRGDMLRDVQILGDVEAMVLRAEAATATLPGGTRVSLQGTADLREETPRIDAEITVTATALRDSLAWAGWTLETVPLEQLRRLEMTGRLTGKPPELALTGLQGTLDTTRFDGDVRLNLADRLGLGLRLTLDRLDLDAYRTETAPPWQDQVLALLRTHDISLDLTAEQLTAARLQADGLALSLEAEDGAVSLHQLEMRALSGVALRASGRYAGAGQGSSHLTLSATAPSLGPAFQALAVGSPLLADKLGPVTLEARIVGDAAKAALDIRLGLLGGMLHVGGEVLTPGETPAPALKLRANLPETMDLLRAVAPATAFPSDATGPLDLYAELSRTMEGALTLTGLQGSFGGASLAGALQWHRPGGAEAAANAPILIDGDLSFGRLDLDRLLPMLTRENGETGLGFTQRLGGRLGVKAERLILAGESAEQVGFTLQAGRGQLRLNGGTGLWQGGRLAVEAGIDQMLTDAEAAPLTGNVTLSLVNAALPAAAPPAGNGLGIRGGMVDLRFTGTAAAANTRQLWSALNGTGTATFRAGTLAGLDLAAMTKRVGDPGAPGSSLRTLALRGGGTGFQSLEWDFTLADQLAALSGIRLASAAGTIAGSGVWHLRPGTLDLDLQVTPALAGEPPPFHLRLAGPMGAPTPRLETAALDSWHKERAAKPAPAAPTPKPAPPAAAAPPPSPAKPTANPRPADANPVSGILDRLKKGG